MIKVNTFLHARKVVFNRNCQTEIWLPTLTMLPDAHFLDHVIIINKLVVV
jgi:hypothetical protein